MEILRIFVKDRTLYSDKKIKKIDTSAPPFLQFEIAASHMHILAHSPQESRGVKIHATCRIY